jgi:uncharacterized damage-inducible protein DinB
MQAEQQLMVKVALDSWQLQTKRANDLINSLTNEDLEKEVAPNRSRGLYLIAHLAAVHDLMFPLLNLGQPLYPQLAEPFIYKPDRAVTELPTIAEIRNYWNTVNEKLTESFLNLQPNEWLLKHNSISAEDFEKEPHRNRLSVLLNRTNHLSYHYGQLAFLKAKTMN